MSTIEQMQNLPLSTDIATQEELNDGITSISSVLIGTIEDLSSADTINGSKKYAKEYANSAINTIISGAPQAFDTLKEIADWISSDQTSSTKLISDVAKLQTDMAAVSNDLSIDISRVTVTEDNGFQKGNSLGFVGDSALTDPYHVADGSDSYAFPINVLTSTYGFTNEELSDAIYNYDSSFTNTIYGYMYDNGFIPSILTSLYGFHDGTQVFAHYGSQYGADMIEWQDSNGTDYDGTSITILPAKVITLERGTKIFREPRVYYYHGGYGDQNGIYTSFTLFVDYEAIPKKKVQKYDSIVSATYATKNEVANSLTEYVDLTSNQTINGNKIFTNTIEAGLFKGDLSCGNGVLVGAEELDSYGSHSKITIYGFENVNESTRTVFTDNIKDVYTPVRYFYFEDLSTNHVQQRSCTWEFPEVINGKTFVFADREYVLSALSSNDSSSSLSDVYVLSGEVVEGLSNTVVPKLSTIADLVLAEVEKVDSISSAMNAQFVPLSDYQTLVSKVTELEARVAALEGN